MVDAYLGCSVQCTQSHLSVWVDLCAIVSQTCPFSIGMTNSSDAIDDRRECAKVWRYPVLVISNGVTAASTNPIAVFAAPGMQSISASCMLPGTVGTGDITWHLTESVSISNACGRMCTDLVGSGSTSLCCGFSRTGSSGRVEYDCHGLGVVRCM